MAEVSDKILWDEIRERGAVHGWDDRERLCGEALKHVCRRFKITDDDTRDDLRGRIDRLWAKNMTIWGPC